MNNQSLYVLTYTIFYFTIRHVLIVCLGQLALARVRIINLKLSVLNSYYYCASTRGHFNEDRNAFKRTTIFISGIMTCQLYSQERVTLKLFRVISTGKTQRITNFS